MHMVGGKNTSLLDESDCESKLFAKYKKQEKKKTGGCFW